VKETSVVETIEESQHRRLRPLTGRRTLAALCAVGGAAVVLVALLRADDLPYPAWFSWTLVLAVPAVVLTAYVALNHGRARIAVIVTTLALGVACAVAWPVVLWVAAPIGTASVVLLVSPGAAPSTGHRAPALSALRMALWICALAVAVAAAVGTAFFLAVGVAHAFAAEPGEANSSVLYALEVYVYAILFLALPPLLVSGFLSSLVRSQPLAAAVGSCVGFGELTAASLIWLGNTSPESAWFAWFASIAGSTMVVVSLAAAEAARSERGSGVRR
jgi:hypothetical protein